MRFQTLFIFIVGLWAFLPQSTSLAAPQVATSLSRESIREDQATTLQIRAMWPKEEGTYRFSIPELTLFNLKVSREGESQESFKRDSKPWVTRVFNYRLTPTSSGTGTIDSFTVSYVGDTVESAGSLRVSAMAVKISQTPASPQLILWMILAVIAVFATGLVGWRLRSRKVGNAEAQKPFEETVVENVQSIANVREEINLKDVAFGLDTELRNFLSNCYDITCKHSTQEEILSSLSAKDLPRDEIASIERLFEKLHEAKYMGNKTDKRTVEKIKNDMIHFIRGKKVVGEPKL